jgi:hypothetical protein
VAGRTRKCNGIVAALVALLVVSLAGPHELSAAESPATEPELDEQALGLLAGFAEHLASAQNLRVRIEVAYDAVQEWGQKVEFGATRTLTMRRPDRLRIDVRHRSGERAAFVFDGTRIWLHDADRSVYASTPVPDEDDLDSTLTFMVDTLQTPVPLARLLRSGLPALLREQVRSASYIGRSELGGTPCHQIAFEGDEVDLQLWIPQSGDPLARRIVLTYREDAGQPQFRADFHDWEISPKRYADELFAFSPPEGTERIPIATIGRREGGTQERAEE